MAIRIDITTIKNLEKILKIVYFLFAINKILRYNPNMKLGKTEFLKKDANLPLSRPAFFFFIKL